MPDALHRCLKKQASAEGRSLNAELIYLLKHALSSQQRMKEWQSRRAQLDKIVGAQPYASNLSVEMLREDRERSR